MKSGHPPAICMRIFCMLIGFPVLASAADFLVAIQLKDKPSLQHREGLAWEDAALHQPYLEELAALGFRAEASLKWQNQVFGRVDSAALGAVRGLHFVAWARPMGTETSRRTPLSKRAYDALDYGAFYALLEKTGVVEFHKQMASLGRAPGEGIRVAVIDNGFYLGHQAFSAILEEGRIFDQHDYVAGQATAVHDSGYAGSHGGQVLSVLGGSLPGIHVGIAPHADFALYRSEDDDTETPLEEIWVASAIQRAVDSGAHVISISLGYRYDFDDLSEHPYDWMDGKTRPAALAALGAARRNTLVVVAMGNAQQQHPDDFAISSPADADSILSVGAMNQQLNGRAGFSSIGPTFDGRLKPEISAPGEQVPAANTSTLDGVVNVDGTSFSTPMVAGIAALLMQWRPQADAQQIRMAVMLSGSLAESPSDSLGYGMVDAWKAASILEKLLTGSPVARPEATALVRILSPAVDALGRRMRAPGQVFHRDGRAGIFSIDRANAKP